MPATVNTVTGALEADQLGQTLMHEHVFVFDPEVELQGNTGWDEEAVVQKAVAQMTELRGLGISTIVDLTVLGLGRYVPRVARVAAESGMNIVAATGIYAYTELPTYFKARIKYGYPTYLRDYFVKDIVEGIGDSGIRAGILKVATDAAGVTEDNEIMLRAVAQAHRLTGVPISTHSHAADEGGLAQQRILQDEGVDLTRVIIGHAGDSTDLAYLEKLLAAGSVIGMDRFGVGNGPSTTERVDVIAELCRRGYAGQMILSHDYASTMAKLPDGFLENGPWKEWRYTLISEEVVPALLEREVPQEQIDQMLIENPRRILPQGAPY